MCVVQLCHLFCSGAAAVNASWGSGEPIDVQASINPAFRSHQLADAEHKAFLGEMHAVRGSSALQKLS